VGKTNIIEAIYYLSTARSFRTIHDKDLIKAKAPFAQISSGPVQITIVDGLKIQKQLKVHQKPARMLQILGVQPSVLFTPESMALANGSPSLRRLFMDVVLSQTDLVYARQLIEYQRALRQRNLLLHQIKLGTSSTESLKMWDELLVTCAIPIVLARKKFVNQMAGINQYYRQISQSAGELSVNYLCSIERHGAVVETEAALTSRFHQRLIDRRVAEMQSARTLVGPHRDDLEILLDQNLLATFGSRGQMRTAVVALKLFEFEYMKSQSDRVPTLLFDDVFSEFDLTHRRQMLDLALGAQIIFTATDLSGLGELGKEVKIINLGA
jgi:DNA replication and repair protein RecF